MSATALQPMGSPLASSTRGVTMDALNRGRSEFEARIERAVGARIVNFHFSADYENRAGDLECLQASGRCIAEAREYAISSAFGTGLKLVNIDQDWSVALFDDGRFFSRQQIERMMKGDMPS